MRHNEKVSKKASVEKLIGGWVVVTYYHPWGISSYRFPGHKTKYGARMAALRYSKKY